VLARYRHLWLAAGAVVLSLPASTRGDAPAVDVVEGDEESRAAGPLTAGPALPSAEGGGTAAGTGTAPDGASGGPPSADAVGPATGAADETIEIVDRPLTPRPGRASSTVTRRQLDERVARSAPDALRWEPGVHIQQTAASQASAYLRGRTGQQTLLFFDGVRLNNGTWRQGPNQYFVTIDARTLAAIDVVRGGASTQFGSDAIGGVIEAFPREPVAGDGWIAPRLQLRAGTADRELGGRAEVALAPRAGTGALLGFGYRDVGELESGGVVTGVDGDQPALVPQFREDGRTQRGTGFRELAWDARLRQRLNEDLDLTAAYYDYRQLDAPRTDQCPPPGAPPDECLRFEEQWHLLTYAALDARLGRWAERARLVASVQNQHERRIRYRPQSFVELGGRDDVWSTGLSATASTAPLAAGPVTVQVDYGADVHRDGLESVAWLEFTDIDFVRYDSRGQYLTGSSYWTGGAFVAPVVVRGALTLRGGARVGFAAADAPGDEESATTPIDRTWRTTAAYAGAQWTLGPDVQLLATVDRSFRAPNLDDLTGRQAAGPGFQFENPALGPEIATTVEVGGRLARRHLWAEAFGYLTRVDDAIARDLREISECPPSARDCQGAWFRYQLVNLDGPSTVSGLEAAVGGDYRRFTGRATLAYAYGSGPNPEERPADPDIPYLERVPLSRIPPLGGNVELRHGWARGYLGAGLRWATAQTRLAPSDRGDPRIPAGGTPGYAAVDLRAGWRFGAKVQTHLVVENVGDAAYRHHGSSINGAGRSLVLNLELTP
jgi:iron complex outermembrane receptor protein/hemoglobin/transferrin/lactoferrin receptor protein